MHPITTTDVAEAQARWTESQQLAFDRNAKRADYWRWYKHSTVEVHRLEALRIKMCWRLTVLYVAPILAIAVVGACFLLL